jgi:hypothetical protein
VSPADKPLVWLEGEIKTPTFSEAARLEAGTFCPISTVQADQKGFIHEARDLPASENVLRQYVGAETVERNEVDEPFSAVWQKATKGIRQCVNKRKSV